MKGLFYKGQYVLQILFYLCQQGILATVVYEVKVEVIEVSVGSAQHPLPCMTQQV